MVGDLPQQTVPHASVEMDIRGRQHEHIQDVEFQSQKFHCACSPVRCAEKPGSPAIQQDCGVARRSRHGRRTSG